MHHQDEEEETLEMGEVHLDCELFIIRTTYKVYVSTCAFVTEIT